MFRLLYVWTCAHACVHSASGHACPVLPLMKLFPDWCLCLLSACCSTCSAAPQIELQPEKGTAHNICDLLRSPNIRWISVTLWLVWWVPAVPSDPHIQYSDPACTATHTHTQALSYTHTVSACSCITSITCQPISLTTNNDLSGAVKPATKIKIRFYVTAQYVCYSSCALFLAESDNRCSLTFLWFGNSST